VACSYQQRRKRIHQYVQDLDKPGVVTGESQRSLRSVSFRENLYEEEYESDDKQELENNFIVAARKVGDKVQQVEEQRDKRYVQGIV
jgi:hypothetical protein